MPIDAATEDFFRLRLDHMIDLRHALAVLSSRMPWQQIEASVSHIFSGKVRAGKKLPCIDLFGEQVQLVSHKSNAGRPRVALRTIIALLYLKHAFNESDEGVVQRWSETPVWQFFGGRAYFDQALPCDSTTLVKFRALLGEAGVEELLAQTITAAVDMALISAKELATVVVDSTVQPKAIAHPTDSKLLETARQKLVQAAKDAGIGLKQTFAKEGRLLRFKAGRYAHAKQFKRMGRAIKRQRTIVTRIARQVERGATALTQAARDALQGSLAKARQIVAQAASRKNTGTAPKPYAWHAPEGECIAKGKSRTPYEFGVKVGIAATLKHNLIVGARSFAGKPYDGHTLHEQLEQASILMQQTGQEPLTAYVDLGYRGVDADNPDISIKHRGKFKTLTNQERKLLKRRQAIEPIIGHLKADHRMDRCYLLGEQGDRLNAVLCAAGYNIKWLLRMIAKKGVAFSQGLYLRLCRAAGVRPNCEQVLRQLMQIIPVSPARRLVSS
ncbi:MAG: IS5 family transposase [Betaproteobacteria bacterium]